MQSTDDAYVSGNVVQITPQISGTVVAIGADDTQFVKAGQTLVRLDEADSKVALDQAEAQLARTVREVRSLFATSAQLQSAIAIRQSELATAEADLARRERLASSGAISGEELQHAREAVSGARAGLLGAQQQFAANRARVDHTTIEDHPGRARTRPRTCATPISPMRAPRCRRRSPASSPSARCSSASA